jgi:hypothetical protein
VAAVWGSRAVGKQAPPKEGRMTSDHEHTGHTHHQPEPESGGGLTGYAIAKYGFILLIVIVVLWFVANYFLGE